MQGFPNGNIGGQANFIGSTPCLSMQPFFSQVWTWKIISLKICRHPSDPTGGLDSKVIFFWS